MEGLEAVEVELRECKSVIDFRIDANTYKKEYIESAKQILMFPTTTIESISNSVQNFGAYSLCNDIEFTDNGIPFLMTQNIRHNYIDWSVLRYVDLDSHNMLYKSHCAFNQVLVTMAGEYLGRVAVYNKDFVCSSNQAIAKVSLKEGISPYYISTFLNSRFGQNQINRLKTITGQPNINMSLIKNLIIPQLSKVIQHRLEEIITQSHSIYDNSEKLYINAENILLNELGLKDWKPTEKATTIKTFADFTVSNRLDAEYYQPKYDEIERKIKAYPNGYCLISEKFYHKKDICKFDKLEYEYIEIGDVNTSNGDIEYSITQTESLPANAKIKVGYGDILISKVRPYRGAIAIIRNDYSDIVVSGAFTVLKETSNVKSEVLQVLLRTDIYKDWLLKFNVGSSYPVIKDEDVLNLPIPLIDLSLQEQITAKIQESFALRVESRRLLELAKTAVEIAIEQGEEKGLELLNIK